MPTQDEVAKGLEENEETTELKIIDKRKLPIAEVPLPKDSEMSVVLVALNKGYSPELIEKMMDLQERHEKNEARKAFHEAMAKFKANPPKVYRDLQVQYEAGSKVTSWSHADLGTAADAINQALGENGLNATWRTDPQENKEIKVTCIITHKLGHSESTWLQAGADTTGSKNAIQAIGSTIFYLERYTLFALTGIAPATMDDNGRTSGKVAEFITEEQAKALNKELAAFPDEGKAFLEFAGAETVDTIYAGTQYKKTLQALKDIKKGKK